MRSFAVPKNSKGRVDRAGDRISIGGERDDDYEVLGNWRAAHANILNTFKTLLYKRASGFDVQIAQRLKRRPTIIDKLNREPGMKLSRMHDIAGCRAIFQDIDELHKFRALMHAGSFEHKRRGADDDRWNYIARPKSSGYRGIHDVYSYFVTPKVRKAREKQPWNGMLVEIQYRTQVQHAWSTAVELVGLVTESDPKFDRGNPEFIEFFRLASEILARVFEAETSCYADMGNEELVQRFLDLRDKTHILSLLSELKISEGGVGLRNAILVFHYQRDFFAEEQLEIRRFDSLSAAISEYSRLELDLENKADIVLVGSRSEDAIKSAYRNYFSDAQEFLTLIKEGVDMLQAESMFPWGDDDVVFAD